MIPPGPPLPSDAYIAFRLSSLDEQVGKALAAVEEMRDCMNDLRTAMAVRDAGSKRFDGSDWPEMKQRVERVEVRVGALEGFRWKILGAIAAAGVLGSALGAIAGIIASFVAG